LNQATAQYAAEISRLIAEIEARIPPDSPPHDREFRLQRDAFRERASLARNLAERLAAASDRQPLTMDGDAHRLKQALELSRAYFSE
jgi:hypothetical protein